MRPKKSERAPFFLLLTLFFGFFYFLLLFSNFFYILFFSLPLSSFFYSLPFSSFPPILLGFLALRFFSARNLVAQIYRICSPGHCPKNFYPPLEYLYITMRTSICGCQWPPWFLRTFFPSGWALSGKDTGSLLALSAPLTELRHSAARWNLFSFHIPYIQLN